MTLLELVDEDISATEIKQTLAAWGKPREEQGKVVFADAGVVLHVHEAGKITQVVVTPAAHNVGLPHGLRFGSTREEVRSAMGSDPQMSTDSHDVWQADGRSTRCDFSSELTAVTFARA